MLFDACDINFSAYLSPLLPQTATISLTFDMVKLVGVSLLTAVMLSMKEAIITPAARQYFSYFALSTKFPSITGAPFPSFGRPRIKIL